MLGIDTNVLVRFLAEDDPVQTPLAIEALSASRNQPIFVGRVVAVEAFWVLTKVKKFPRQAVIDAYRSLLGNLDFMVENEGVIARALDHCEQTGSDFADALIAIENLAAGCETTITFDEDALELDGMMPVKSRI